MTYLESVETYGEEDEKYFQQWELLSEEEKTEVFLQAAEMRDKKKVDEVGEMHLMEISRNVSEGTLQGMVDALFELMDPIPIAKQAVRLVERGGQ